MADGELSGRSEEDEEGDKTVELEASGRSRDEIVRRVCRQPVQNPVGGLRYHSQGSVHTV